MKFDTEYHDRILQVLIEAVCKASMGDDKLMLVKVGEVADAALDLIALFAATSTETQTPAQRRQFTDECGKKLIRKLVGVQTDIARHGLPPSMQVLREGDIN